MSAQRSTVPNADWERVEVPAVSLVDSLANSRFRFDNLQTSLFSEIFAEARKEESVIDRCPPSLLDSVYPQQKRVERQLALASESKPSTLPTAPKSPSICFGNYLQNTSDHFLIDEVMLPVPAGHCRNTFDQQPPPLTMTGGQVAPGLSCTVIKSSSESDIQVQPLETGSIHASLVIPRFNKMEEQSFFNRSSVPQWFCQPAERRDQNLLQTNFPFKDKANLSDLQRSETRSLLKSLLEEIKSRNPESPHNSQLQSVPLPSLSATVNPQLAPNATASPALTSLPKPASPAPLSTAPMSRRAANSLKQLAKTEITASSKPQPNLIGTALKEFLTRFFTDEPFTEAHCVFTPPECQILASIFSRKYEFKVETK